MPRLAKWKRDEIRFGKLDRLADIMAAGRVVPPRWIDVDGSDPHYAVWEEIVKDRCDWMFDTKLIDASNVCEYAFGVGFKEQRSRDDFPCCTPPFEWSFIEMASPPGRNWPFRRFGWLICSERLDSNSGNTIWRNGKPLPEKGWRVQMDLAVLDPRQDIAIYPAITEDFVLDELGAIALGPYVELPLSCCATNDPKKKQKMEAWGEMSGTYSTPVMLALCFMNCKGTTIHAAEPDAALNRARRKAKMKPFLRYHTINIEPMKRVLQTEGNVESNGLKKALHICRGHFSTYSEERPLFGRIAGTFWVPAHVRGNRQQGVVISDYQVSGPKMTEDGDSPVA